MRLGFMVFFFSSRRRHTRSLRDWSSDVCSSDLSAETGLLFTLWVGALGARTRERAEELHATLGDAAAERSEERRVGKECRSRWSPDHYKKKSARSHQTQSQAVVE